jgi:hypothetical protein
MCTQKEFHCRCSSVHFELPRPLPFTVVPTTVAVTTVAASPPRLPSETGLPALAYAVHQQSSR